MQFGFPGNTYRKAQQGLPAFLFTIYARVTNYILHKGLRKGPTDSYMYELFHDVTAASLYIGVPYVRRESVVNAFSKFPPWFCKSSTIFNYSCTVRAMAIPLTQRPTLYSGTLFQFRLWAVRILILYEPRDHPLRQKMVLEIIVVYVRNVRTRFEYKR